MTACLNTKNATVLGSYSIDVTYTNGHKTLDPVDYPILTEGNPTDTQTVKFTPQICTSIVIQVDLSYRSYDALEAQIGSGSVGEKLYLYGYVVIAEKTVLKEIEKLQSTPMTFQKTNNKQAFNNKLIALYKLVDKGTVEAYVLAMDKIQIDLMPKTYGVAPDWMTATSQATVYAQLQLIYDDLARLSA